MEYVKPSKLETVPPAPPAPVITRPSVAHPLHAAYRRLSAAYDTRPDNTVRGVITFLLVGAMLWMQWHSPKDGTVPAALISAAGLATGYYLTQQDASKIMRAALSVCYVAAFCAFLITYGWLPDTINAQVTMIVGIYYGRKTGTDK